tara:strand:- start:79 stop:252 length:174 start_codon:yes stop_codon:yes gene_type:complete
MIIIGDLHGTCAAAAGKFVIKFVPRIAIMATKALLSYAYKSDEQDWYVFKNLQHFYI